VSTVSRRRFLAASAATTGLLPFAALPPSRAASPAVLRVVTRTPEVDGKPATVFAIEQPDGTRGLELEAGARLLVEVENHAGEPTLIHRHGPTPPWRQDRVPGIGRPPLAHGGRCAYDLDPRPPGSHWMHSRHGLQEQRLMAAPLIVRAGERVELTFEDRTTMAHPMRLHGHHFQVVAVGGERIKGAKRDTVLVPARGHVTVAFDADNPGIWALHCHNLYHIAAGMMTTVEYET
jgi:FtsP/CotA-like multicopper oxidase with cupredoxin domain